MDMTSLLFEAAKAGDLDEVMRLLPASDPLAKYDDGSTALMMAAESGQQECVETLLSYSTIEQLDMSNAEGKTAEILAFKGGHTQIESLIKSCALSLKEKQELQVELRNPRKKVKSVSI